MSARSPSRAATRRSTCCSCARPTSPSTSRTASSTAASPAPTSCRSAAPTSTSCSGSGSAPARSRPRCRRSRAIESLEELDGHRAATVYPRLAGRLLAERGLDVELVEVTGSVEVAPRLGLADAIVDLVSSGNTLRRTACARSARSSRPRRVLIGRHGADGRACAAGRHPAQRRRRAREPVPDAERARRCRRPDPPSSCRARARRASCRSPSRAWSRCTRSSPPTTSGGCCHGWRRRAHRRSCSSRSSGCSDERGRRDRRRRARAWRRRGARVGSSGSTARRPRGRRRPATCPLDALRTLADAVRRWHALQRPADVRLEIAPGVELERRWVPLRSVGVYVPRRLVSTLVMCGVPAQVAGVERIVVVTPPDGAGTVAAAARGCSASTRSGRSAAHRRSQRSRTGPRRSRASTRSSARGTRT